VTHPTRANQYQADRLKETSLGNYAPELRNRYLFQGQELQKDLDLGWYQFKWRMHDPAIGRFGAVDPLSEKYVHNGTYVFSENKVTTHFELEGLEGLRIHEYRLDQNGDRVLNKIIYQQDVYVITGTRGNNYSNYTSFDVSGVRENLKNAFPNNLTDPSLNVPIEFKFNVQQLDFSYNVPKYNSQGEFVKNKIKSLDIQTSELAQHQYSRSRLVDNGLLSTPAFVFSQKLNGTDGGLSDRIIRVDPNSREGEVAALGHEKLHFMLGNYRQPGRDTEQLHHDLGGLLGRPFKTPWFNNEIIDKLREYVPRASHLDYTIKN
jgi:RHS repeat-associated protein